MSQYLINLPDRGSYLHHSIDIFHIGATRVILFIFFFVSIIGIFLVSKKFHYNKIIDGQVLEIIWTAVPAVILIFLAIPSLRLLYQRDEIYNNNIRVKATGGQWYWTYDIPFLGVYSIDSYIVTPSSLETGDRLFLKVDNPFLIISKINSIISVTSRDVLHSFTVPSVGVKIDAVPGRLNNTSILVNDRGIYYGQCREICGANHSFIPIVIEVI